MSNDVNHLTKIPLTWLFISIPALIGLVTWFTTLQVDASNTRREVQQAQDSIHMQDQKISVLLEMIYRMDSKIEKGFARIETKLGVKEQGD